MRAARLFLLMGASCVVALAAGCNHHHYYGYPMAAGTVTQLPPGTSGPVIVSQKARPPKAARVASTPVIVGDACEVPGAVGGAAVAGRPVNSGPVIVESAPPSRVASGTPYTYDGYSSRGWKNRRDYPSSSGAAGSTRVTGTIDDEDLVR
jgi:hypothetical protein